MSSFTQGSGYGKGVVFKIDTEKTCDHLCYMDSALVSDAGAYRVRVRLKKVCQIT